MQDSSGFRYYYSDILDLESGALLCSFDFDKTAEISSGVVSSASWSNQNSYTGFIKPSISSLQNSISGSGHFDGGNHLEISGNIPSQFTVLFCYEKLRNESEILLSSMLSGTNGISGLNFGLNSNNYAFLEYYNDVDGIFSKTFSQTNSSKNIFFLQNDSISFKFGRFDPSVRVFQVEEFPIFELNYIHSDKFILAKKPNIFNFNNLQNFSGLFDSFYCISGAIQQDYLNILASGLYSFYQEPQFTGIYQDCYTGVVISGSGFVIGTGVTGYTSTITYQTGYVPTGYFLSGYSYLIGTGVTGYQDVFIGQQEDGCGEFQNIYIKSGVTGSIYASGVTGIYTGGMVEILTPTYSNIELTGVITGTTNVEVQEINCSGISGYSSAFINVDNSFIRSIGYDAISIFYNSEIDGEKFFVESYFNTGVDNVLNLNKVASLDSVKREFSISFADSGKNKNIFFANGQLILESGFNEEQSGYFSVYYPSGDFFSSGNLIYSNGHFNENDFIGYDHSESLNFRAKKFNSSFSGLSGSEFIFSDFIFLNGVKLASGIDYNSSSGFFTGVISSGDVVSQVNSNYMDSVLSGQTGSFDSLILNNQKFLPRNSAIYLNGLRSFPSLEYYESSKFSNFSGHRIVKSNYYQFVNSFNSSGVWNM